MNNDPGVYHVSFLLNVRDNDGGEGWKGKSEIGERTRLNCRQPSRERGKGGRGDACDERCR